MPRVVIESLEGFPDGVNRFFRTRVPYLAGSTIVYRNGQALIATLDDGWFERGTTLLEMKEAPLLDDHLSAYYIPA